MPRSFTIGFVGLKDDILIYIIKKMLCILCHHKFFLANINNRRIFKYSDQICCICYYLEFWNLHKFIDFENHTYQQFQEKLTEYENKHLIPLLSNRMNTNE